MRRRLCRRHRHRHVIGDDDEFGFQVDAVLLAHDQHRIARTIESRAHRLIHQRVGIETFRHVGAARAAHALDMRQIRAAIDEFVGARQGRSEQRRIERQHFFAVDRLGAAFIQELVNAIQARCCVAPVLERRLQGARDIADANGFGQIAIDDNQGSITATGLQTCKFHFQSFRYFN